MDKNKNIKKTNKSWVSIINIKPNNPEVQT